MSAGFGRSLSDTHNTGKRTLVKQSFRNRVNFSREPDRYHPKMTIARWLWLLYIMAILAVGVGRSIEKVITNTGGLTSRYGPGFAAIIIAIGIIGLAWQLRIGRAWMWASVCVLGCGASLGLLVLEVIIILGSGAPLRIHAMIIGGVALSVPGLAGLFTYAFMSRRMWRNQPDDDASGFAGTMSP